MNEIDRLMDTLIELSGQRSTHMVRINILSKKYIKKLEDYSNYIMGISYLLEPKVAKEILTDLEEFGEIVKEFGESLAVFGEDWNKQLELDIELINTVTKDKLK